jgi:hypothetical protein
MACTKTGYAWTAITVAEMAGNLTNQDYTAKTPYSSILINTYGASEVWPLVDIASGTIITAKANAARNGALAGWDLRNAAGPVTGTLAPYFDGADGSDYGDLDTVSHRSVFNGGIGSVVISGRVSNAADWSDGATRHLFVYKVDNSNWIYAIKHGTLGMRFVFVIGGVTKVVTIGVLDTSWFQVGASWKDSANGNEAKVFANGSQSGATQTGFGAWAGTPTILSLASGTDNSSQNVWKGWLANHAVKFGSIWSPTDYANMYTALAGAGPENP